MNCMILNYILKCIKLRFYAYLVWQISMVLLVPIDGRMEPIACVLFYLVMKTEVLNILAKSHIKHGQRQH